MFNVREMLPKSGGLKVLRRPRILLLGFARTSLGLLKSGVDHRFGEEQVGEPDVTRLEAMGASGLRMLLGTRRYQVGSDGGFRIADASRNSTLPGWQLWGLLDRGCF